MTPKKRQLLMFTVLIASVLFGMYMKPWQPRALPVVPSDVASIPVSEDSAKAAAAIASIEYVSEWPARDPFSRPEEYVHVSNAIVTETVAPAEPGLVLQGIMTVGGQMAAVIDGKTCAVGAQVSGWKLEKIEAQGVWISQGGERRFVPLQ